jgi:hypothetical protein
MINEENISVSERRKKAKEIGEITGAFNAIHSKQIENLDNVNEKIADFLKRIVAKRKKREQEEKRDE